MAARKKGTAKSGRSGGASKRTRTKAAARATKGATGGALSRALTDVQRRKLLAPPERYDEIAADLVAAWAADRTLRVPSLTLTRLRALSAAADRAREREAAFREEMERRLGILSDARLEAENDLWRAVLAVNAAVKAHALRDAAILDRFAFLDDAIVRVPRIVPGPARRTVV